MSSESTSGLRSLPVKQQSLHSKTDLQKDRHRQSQLHDFDVLVQSGQLSETSAAGNQNFQHLVHLNIALYNATKSHTERYYITQSIVRSIRHEGGRFLQYVSAWPRHASSSPDAKTPDPDDSIWILKEMTEEQAEAFTGKTLDETIQNKQQHQHQQRSQDTSLAFFNNRDLDHTTSSQQVYPRQKIMQSSSRGPRKPFRVLQPQIFTPSLEQEKPRLLQESRLAESEYGGNDLEVRLGNDEDGIVDVVNNQENNPLLVGNHGITPASIGNFPPSPPVALLIMPTKAATTWTVSPIRNQRKRLRVDAFGDSPPPSPSTVPRLPPMKRCRWHCDD